MQYKTSAEMAKIWNVSQRTVRNFCAMGKIPSAVYSGKQWMIPSDTKIPLDGRTKQAKENKEAYTIYHFPVFAFSPLYAYPEELTEEERALRKAQILHFEGKNVESIALCRDMLSTNLPTYLIVGAYVTIGFCSILLGLFQQYRDCVDQINEIVKKEKEHKEDYLLILNSLRFNTEWKQELVLDINPMNLSNESLIYYKFVILTASVFSKTKETQYSMSTHYADLCYFQNIKADIAVFNIAALLAIRNNLTGNEAIKETLIKLAFDVACENGWLPKMAKYYDYLSTAGEKYLKEKGSKYYLEIVEKRNQNVRNWEMVKQNNINRSVVSKLSSKQTEVLVLHSMGIPNNKMSALLNVSVETIEQEYQNILDALHIKDPKELEEILDKMMNGEKN